MSLNLKEEDILLFPNSHGYCILVLEIRIKMAVPVKISIEQLAESLNNLSVSERDRLKSLLHSEWFEKEEVNEKIMGLLQKSSEQHRNGETRPSEEILRESKQKYGF